MTKIDAINFDYSDLDVVVSCFEHPNSFDIHNSVTGEHITTCCDLAEAEYYLSAMRS